MVAVAVYIGCGDWLAGERRWWSLMVIMAGDSGGVW